MAMGLRARREFTERERWQFDNDGVLVIEDAISPSVCHSSPYILLLPRAPSSPSRATDSLTVLVPGLGCQLIAHIPSPQPSTPPVPHARCSQGALRPVERGPGRRDRV